MGEIESRKIWSRFHPICRETWFWVSLSISGILLIAGCSKIISQTDEHFSLWYFSLAVLEILIFLFVLVGGWRSVFSWLLLTVFFGAISSAASILVANGVSQCPCFGTARFSPLKALSIDLIALLVLFLYRPRLFPLNSNGLNDLRESTNTPVLRWRECEYDCPAWIGRGVRLLFLGILLASVLPFANSTAVLGKSQLSNRHPGTTKANMISIKSATTVDKTMDSISTLTITNLSSSMVHLSDVSTSCVCMRIESQPIKLAPGGQGLLVIRSVAKSDIDELSLRLVMEASGSYFTEVHSFPLVDR